MKKTYKMEFNNPKPHICGCHGFGSKETYSKQVLINVPTCLISLIGKAEIAIDPCIEEEIKFLWSKGIATINSCCGHDKLPPSVVVLEEDELKMRELGYQSLPISTHVFILKSWLTNPK